MVYWKRSLTYRRGKDWLTRGRITFFFYRDLLPELQERITKCLDGMVETGKIKRSRTVNDTAYGND